jgi:hypothetical protein
MRWLGAKTFAFFVLSTLGRFRDFEGNVSTRAVNTPSILPGIVEIVRYEISQSNTIANKHINEHLWCNLRRHHI